MKKLSHFVATATIVTLHSVFVFVFLSLLATIPVSLLAQEQTLLKEVAYHPFVKEGNGSWGGSWGRFSDHFFDKKELNDVAIFK